MGQYQSIEEIKEANRKRGGSFFDPETVEHFQTIVYPEVYGGELFITSDINVNETTERVYSVRRCYEFGGIVGVEGSMYLPKKLDAIMAAERLAAQIEE